MTLNYNAAPSEFQGALNQFDLYGSYWIACNGLEAFDSTGASVSSTSTSATKFKWTVSIYKLRPDSILSQKFTTKLGGIVAAAGSTPKFT